MKPGSMCSRRYPILSSSGRTVSTDLLLRFSSWISREAEPRNTSDQAQPYVAFVPSMEPSALIGVSIESERSRLETPCATINTENDALARGVGPHELECGRNGADAEEPRPGAKDHGIGQKPVFTMRSFSIKVWAKPQLPGSWTSCEKRFLSSAISFTTSLMCEDPF
jgi:hypothetical protein